MTLQELARELKPDVGENGTATVLIWREERKWRFELLWGLDAEEAIDDSLRIEAVKAIDPYAVVADAYENFAADTQVYIARQVSRLYEMNRLDAEGKRYCPRCLSTDIRRDADGDYTPDDLAFVCAECGQTLHFAAEAAHEVH
jgi:hypothetical protein